MEIGMGVALGQTKQNQAMKSLQQTKSTRIQKKKNKRGVRTSGIKTKEKKKNETKRPPVEIDKSKRNQKARDNGQQYCILIANGSRPETTPFRHSPPPSATTYHTQHTYTTQTHPHTH